MIQPAPPGPHPSVFFSPPRAAPTRPLQASGQRRVLACLDNKEGSRSVLGHALAVANSLDLPITLARVLESSFRFDAPADPVQWQQQRHRGRDQLERLARGEAGATTEVESVLLAGPPAEELDRWARDHDVSLVVLGTHDFEQGEREGLGTTAQRLLASAEASLLLVPPAAADAAGYRRLLVPLDGSSRAESVLPVAVRIARAQHAELVLAHIVPQLEVVRFGVAERSLRELRERLDQRNDAEARSYLETLRRRMLDEPFPVRTLIARDGDARAQLRRLVIDEAVDLVVLSSHGSTGLPDMPCGSVTEYLAMHAPAPMLIVRPNFAIAFEPGPERVGDAAS